MEAVIRAFWRYIQVIRILQSTYWLEATGSHGVWGLDDYHFLPFLFRSAQLRGHKYLRLKAIHDNEVVDELANDYVLRLYQVSIVSIYVRIYL
ncbi:hypothetical protein EDD15DRAFT_2303106 [Pisolithus albus]|nr:hypothetical protein EDD15DRAFT_2303106 [Pisolithus albus]